MIPRSCLKRNSSFLEQFKTFKSKRLIMRLIIHITSGSPIFNFFILISSASIVQCVSPSLKMVQILFRHGDRYPIWTYPNDPHRNEPIFAKKTLGQLTEVGKRQQYALGRFLRSRYDGFISKTYLPSEVSMLSSDMDRTIMSAQMNLAGLYKPVNLTLNWNPTIDWTPVPVRTIPKDYDKLLGLHKPCPKLKHVTNQIEEAPFFKKVLNKYYHFLEELKTYTGIKELTLAGAAVIRDIVLVEKLNHYEVPAWTKGKSDLLDRLTALDMMFKTFNIEAKRLSAGPLIKTIIDTMKSSSKKIHLYSGHDSTLARLMGALNIFNLQPPPYASALIFELHTSPSGLIVQILYRNASDHEPFELEIPECKNPCLLETLVQVTGHLIPQDWESECSELNLSMNSPILRVFLVMGTLMASVIALTIVVLCSQKRKPSKKFFFPRCQNGLQQYQSI